MTLDGNIALRPILANFQLHRSRDTPYLYLIRQIIESSLYKILNYISLIHYKQSISFILNATVPPDLYYIDNNSPKVDEKTDTQRRNIPAR